MFRPAGAAPGQRFLTSMDVLLVGSDNPVGAALRGVLAQWGRHRAAGLTAAASRWRRERQAKKAVRKGRPDAVVDCRLAWQIAAGDVVAAGDIERGHWLAKACEHSGMRYILLSCDRVFSGLTGRRLRESDPADAPRAPGAQMRELESRVAQAAPSALVLRTGPLFAGSGRNLLTQTLERMDPAAVAEFDDRDVFCPVSSADAARVLAAVLDQLSVGATARGIYHYCSCDRATAYAFAEAALAAASRTVDRGTVVIRPRIDDDGQGAASRVLDCSRLRDTFAVKQAPWRPVVNALVQQYYRAQAPAG